MREGLLDSALGRLRQKRSWLREQRELRAIRALFYSRFMGEDDLIFDVGANVGDRTSVFASLSRTVVAVEPQNHCVAILHKQFDGNPKVKLVPKAVGSQEGQAEIFLCNEDSLSSLSPVWIAAVQKSGRFPANEWDRKHTVEVTTLDKLITEFGMPAFIKIDVEGYEYEVLRGLSKPIRALSFEFTPECLQYCYCSLLSAWVAAEEIKSQLSHFTDEPTAWGDVYARFEGVG
jgi:FkbM family methyltransferase